MKNYILAIVLSLPVFFYGCKKDSSSSGGGFNLFTIEDDKQLGLQVKQEIANNPGEYPILDPAAYPEAYAYITGIKNDILASGNVAHANDFSWEIYIVKRDDVQNAFCTPGGYIYIYTGLIKYLESKSALAGVMGHEMAHADRRHSTEQLTKAYGVQTLLDIVLGNNQGLVSEVAAQLVNLDFSRADETEADMYSVIYLCPTKYNADGAAEFFKKITAEGGSNPPEFLSTHPNPDNRVEKIESEAQQRGCTPSIDATENTTSYAAFKQGV